MKSKALFTFAFPLLLLAVAPGCVTSVVWTNAESNPDREPSVNPDLQVFNAAAKQDLLVVYREYNDRTEQIRSRAYLLYRNAERVRRNQRPEFVSVERTRTLPPVPIFASAPPPETIQPEMLYVVAPGNGPNFTVWSGEREVGSHRLPMYQDNATTWKKVALTPFAVAADVGLFGGYLWLISLDSDD